MNVDYSRFDALTFDCYGTLIDWERGLADAFRPVLQAHGVEREDEDVLTRYARHEATLQAGPYLRYRDVVGEALRRVAGELGFEPSATELAAFSGSVADWPAFPDAADALARLGRRFGLGVITNCDDDLFAASNRRLGEQFEWVVTAEQVGSYKPDARNFHAAFERIGLPQERILHVAQSVFHDHVTAKQLGLATVWIDRRGERASPDTRPPAEAAPDATFPDMASFAAAAA
jgi:2-haloacid dehalogenase